MPMEPVKYLDGRHRAQEIAYCCQSAYWAACAEQGRSDPHYADFLRKEAEAHLVKLAEEFGYRLEKLEPWETGE